VNADADGDSYGNAQSTMNACSQPAGFMEDNTDCDDADNNTYPKAEERCDGLINDCDSNTLPLDEVDNDGDGYVECTADSGEGVDETFKGDDCNDSNPTNQPGADEYCDREDNDCDEESDENTGIDATDWYMDGDGDDFGDEERSPERSCDQPSGMVAEEHPIDNPPNGSTSLGASLFQCFTEYT
jgi:hypothetical protein